MEASGIDAPGRGARAPAATALAFLLALCGARASAIGDEPLGPPNERTGAPLELTCAEFPLCHHDELVDAGLGDLQIILPPSYVPAETYAIEVRLSQTGQMRWGFELTALDSAGDSVGSLASTDAETQVSVSNGTTELLGRQSVKHTPLGTAAGQPDAKSWSFEWTAPPSDVGPVSFYAAGNAADDNGFNFRLPGQGDAGDFIYTAQQTLSVPEPGAPVVGLALALALAARHRRPVDSRDAVPPRG